MAVIWERVTHLELRDRSALKHSERTNDVELRFVPLDREVNAHYIRTLTTEIGRASGWSSSWWSDEEWAGVLAIPRTYFAIEGERDGIWTAIGILVLSPVEKDSQEIYLFGLLPDYVGKHLGGPALTRAAEFAFWKSGQPRVWLHTSSRDLPVAIQNYLARGFEVFKVEETTKEIPDDVLAAVRADRPDYGIKPGWEADG